MKNAPAWTFPYTIVIFIVIACLTSAIVSSNNEYKFDHTLFIEMILFVIVWDLQILHWKDKE